MSSKKASKKVSKVNKGNKSSVGKTKVSAKKPVSKVEQKPQTMAETQPPLKKKSSHHGGRSDNDIKLLAAETRRLELENAKREMEKQARLRERDRRYAAEFGNRGRTVVSQKFENDFGCDFFKKFY